MLTFTRETWQVAMTPSTSMGTVIWISSSQTTLILPLVIHKSSSMMARGNLNAPTTRLLNFPGDILSSQQRIGTQCEVSCSVTTTAMA